MRPRREAARLARRLAPGGLVLATAALVLLVPGLRDTLRPAMPVLTWVLLIGGLLLGLRLGTDRIVLALALLALAGLAVAGLPSPAGPAGQAVRCLAPLNLAAVAWSPERTSRGRRPGRWAAAVGVQAVVVAILAHPAGAALARTLAPLDEALPWPLAGRPALLATAVAGALALLPLVRRPRPAESGLLWAVVSAGLGLSARDPFLTDLLLGAAALVMATTVVETSRTMAYSDDLTGLPARRALDELLDRVGPPYAVGMVDIDHFKRFNDTYGHQVGDQLLRRVAATLAGVTGGGRAFRYGGEEFLVVFPGLTAGLAAPHLEALRRTMAARAFAVRARGRRRRGAGARTPDGAADERVAVTVSIGVADSLGHTGPAEVVRAADQAMYRAKEAGRNRLVVWSA